MEMCLKSKQFGRTSRTRSLISVMATMRLNYFPTSAAERALKDYVAKKSKGKVVKEFEL